MSNVHRLILGIVFLMGTSAWAADADRSLKPVSKPLPKNEKRVALVIGNSAYKGEPLANPTNDARDIAGALKNLGFMVTLKENAGQKEMKQAVREFGNQIKQGGVGLFYFAGHGMQVKGRNFLVPVGTDIQSEDEVEDQSVDASLVLEKMETAGNRVNIVILDACRNNPFARSFRSTARGLAQMDAAKGSFIAYATAPGSVAADGGGGRNGLYTQHLLASLRQPESDIEKVFKRVRAAVAAETKGKQIPWESSSLIGDFYFNPKAKPGLAADPLAVEVAYWESIKDSNNVEDYKAYLKKYPIGQFADLAKRRALNPPKHASTTAASIAPVDATTPKPEPVAVAGKVWKEPTTGMEFVWIPKGCFLMGSPSSEAGRSAFENQREVCVDSFWIGKYEVSVGQHKQFRPDHSDSDNNLPVNWVNTNDVIDFTLWLWEKTGQKFRLPTEVEWEYAARGSTQTPYFWGDSFVEGYGNYGRLFFSGRMPVGSFKPNSYGLYDMVGNVSEWTASLATNRGGGIVRVARGGYYKSGETSARSAFRAGYSPEERANYIGFRLVKEP